MDCEAVVRVLERCTPLVYSHLVLSSSVIDKLRDDDVISDSVVKKMKNLDTEGQITLLLEILRKRGSSTFKRFLGVLKKTFHGTLADKLVLCDPVRFSDALLLDPGLYHPPPETINLAYPTGEFFDPKINTNVYVTTPTEKADSVKANEENQNGDTFNFREKPKSFLQEGKEDVDVDDELSRMRAYFENQQSSTAKVLSALKQEEVVIRELLDQNAKEQEQFRQNRSTLEEINRRVREISSRTGYLADAAPRLSVSDFRLATLNSLPWTAGKTEN